MANAIGTSHASAQGRSRRRPTQRRTDTPRVNNNAVLFTLTDPVLWCSVTALMTGWSFPVFQLWKQRVPKYKLHAPRWGGEAPTFPQKCGAIAHVAIIEDNQRALEMAYELLKARASSCSSLARSNWAQLQTKRRASSTSWRVQRAAAASRCSNGWLRWRPRSACAMSYLKNEFPSETTRVPYQFLLQAVRDDDLELTKWYYEHECHLGSEESFERCYVMDHAVSLEMLQLMHAHREVHCTIRAMDRAVELGDLGMVKFLYKNRDEGCTTDATSSAAAKGHVEIVRFLHENRSEGCTTHNMNVAARNGHLEVVRFLHEYRSEGCSKYAMDMAAGRGRLDIVKFLHENRSEGCTENAMDMAVRCGHSGVVKFLSET